MALPDSYLQFKEGEGNISPIEPLPQDKISNPASSFSYFIAITFVIVISLILLVGYSSARGNPFSFVANYFHTENWWGARENIAVISDSLAEKRRVENTEFDTKINLKYTSKSIAELDKNLNLDLDVDLAGVVNVDNTTTVKTILNGSVNRDSGKYNFSIADGSLNLTTKYSGGNLYYNIFASPQMIDLFVDNKDSRVGLPEYFSKDLKVVGQSSFYNNLIFEGSAYWETNLNAYSLSKISKNDSLYFDYYSIFKTIFSVSKNEIISKVGRASVNSTDDSIYFRITPSTNFSSKKSSLLKDLLSEISKSATDSAEDYCLNSDRVIAQACKEKIISDLTNLKNLENIESFWDKLNINYFDFYIDAVSGRMNKYEFEIELPKEIAENNFENILAGSNITNFYLKISHTSKSTSPVKIQIQDGKLYDDFYKLLFQ